MSSSTLQLQNLFSGNIGGAEIVGGPGYGVGETYEDSIGRYKIQQDVVAGIKVDKSFFQASEEERKEKYKQAFEAAWQVVDQSRGMAGGSTVLVVGASFAEDKKTLQVHTANLGDSTSFLVVYDAKGNIIREKSRMLNALHEAGNSMEEARIRKKGGRLQDDGNGVQRLGGILQCTSSIEANRLPGLGTEPEYIEQKPITLDEGEHAVLIVSCDGMLEGPFDKYNHPELNDVSYDTADEKGRQKYCDIALDWIKKAVTPEELLTGDPCLLASKLMQKSIETSSDNISILVHKLSPEDSPVLLAVCDGHGSLGEKIAKCAAMAIADKLGEPQSLEDCLVREEKPRSIDAINSFVKACEREKNTIRLSPVAPIDVQNSSIENGFYSMAIVGIQLLPLLPGYAGESADAQSVWQPDGKLCTELNVFSVDIERAIVRLIQKQGLVDPDRGIYLEGDDHIAIRSPVAGQGIQISEIDYTARDLYLQYGDPDALKLNACKSLECSIPEFLQALLEVMIEKREEISPENSSAPQLIADCDRGIKTIRTMIENEELKLTQPMESKQSEFTSLSLSPRNLVFGDKSKSGNPSGSSAPPSATP